MKSQVCCSWHLSRCFTSLKPERCMHVKEEKTGDTRWPLTVEMCKYFHLQGFIWLFYSYAYKRSFFWTPQGKAMLFCSQPMRSRKGSRLVTHMTLLPHTLALFMSLTQTAGTQRQLSWSCFCDCQTSVFNKMGPEIQWKLLCVFFFSIPVDRMSDPSLLSLPFKGVQNPLKQELPLATFWRMELYISCWFWAESMAAATLLSRTSAPCVLTICSAARNPAMLSDTVQK